MKKILLVAIIFLVLAGLLIKTPKKPVEKKLQKVTVMMPFIPSISWMSYYTAINKKYYQDEGLDVKIQYTAKGAAGPIEQLEGGKVDLIHTAEESVIMARSKGLDVVAVYPILPANTYYIISEKTLNITEPSDLIGKKIGVISPASATYDNLMVILNLAKVDKNSVEIIQAGSTQASAFLEKKFEAASVHLDFRLLIEEKMPDINIINASDYSDIGRGHIATSSKLIKNNPEIISKFLKATKKGLDYAVQYPTEAVEIYLSFNPDAESQKKYSQNYWNALIKEHKYDKALPGLEKFDNWNKSQDILFETGMITKKTDVSAMFTNKFIPK